MSDPKPTNISQVRAAMLDAARDVLGRESSRPEPSPYWIAAYTKRMLCHHPTFTVTKLTNSRMRYRCSECGASVVRQFGGTA